MRAVPGSGGIPLARTPMGCGPSLEVASGDPPKLDVLAPAGERKQQLGPADIVILPRDLMYIIAAFIAPAVAPVLRTCRLMYNSYKDDPNVWVMSAQYLQASKQGRKRLRRISSNQIASMPSLNRFVPWLIAEGVQQFALSPSGALLACRSGSTFRIFDCINELDLIATLRLTNSRFLSAPCFTHDSTLLVCGKEGGVDVFSCGSWTKVSSYTTSREEAHLCVCVASDGTLISGTFSGKLFLWNGDSAPRTVVPVGDMVICIQGLPTSVVFVTGHSRGLLQTWTNSGERQVNFAGHLDDVNDVAFAGEKYFQLVSASKDRTVRVWDVAKGACLHVYRINQSVLGLARSSSDWVVLALGGNHQVRMLPPLFAGGEQERALPIDHAICVRFSALRTPKGQELFVMAMDYSVFRLIVP